MIHKLYLVQYKQVVRDEHRVPVSPCLWPPRPGAAPFDPLRAGQMCVYRETHSYLKHAHFIAFCECPHNRHSLTAVGMSWARHFPQPGHQAADQALPMLLHTSFLVPPPAVYALAHNILIHFDALTVSIVCFHNSYVHLYNEHTIDCETLHISIFAHNTCTVNASVR